MSVVIDKSMKMPLLHNDCSANGASSSAKKIKNKKKTCLDLQTFETFEGSDIGKLSCFSA